MKDWILFLSLTGNAISIFVIYFMGGKISSLVRIVRVKRRLGVMSRDDWELL